MKTPFLTPVIGRLAIFLNDFYPYFKFEISTSGYAGSGVGLLLVCANDRVRLKRKRSSENEVLEWFALIIGEGAKMAVITKYIVVRNGVELDKVFTVKKEAEAYDKMLDAADNLAAFIKASEMDIDIDGKTIDAISILLAKNGPNVVKMLKGIKPMVSSVQKEKGASPEKAAPVKEKKQAKGTKSQRKTK